MLRENIPQSLKQKPQLAAKVAGATAHRGRVALWVTVALLWIISLLLPSGLVVPPLERPTGPHMERLWGQQSPYYPVARYAPVPRLCEVVQANILQRHGARYPTLKKGVELQAAVARLKAASHYTDVRYEFLRRYTYGLGTNALLHFGAAELFKAGEEAFMRYRHLVNETQLPFVRACESERVVMSAMNWTAGFISASQNNYDFGLSVALPETGNSTLDDNMCPNVGSAYEQVSRWQSIYGPPLAAKLNKAAPGANLTNLDVFSLLTLCPFETLAQEAHSPFCDLFTIEDFEALEFLGDVEKYYRTGYGQLLGRVQGVGYVNELLARLTGKAVMDETQTNRTLDASPETFPLNRTLYADFSHDNAMIAVFAALGLFEQEDPLDPSAGPQAGQTWVVSKMVPFAGRMVVEKVVCPVASPKIRSVTREERVRILVNDQVQPLGFCGAGSDGMCHLDAFVKSQVYARRNGEGDFEKCF